MKPLVTLLALLAVLALACGRSSGGLPGTLEPVASPTVWSTAVPPEYQTTYYELDSTLDSFIGWLPETGGPAPTFAAELAFANGNVGPTLLEAEVLQLVRRQLDTLRDMGVGGVVIAITFPLLDPTFPRSDEYLEFYKQVVAEARQRGIKTLVESGPAFSGTIYSPLRVDWTQYTAESFLAARQDQLVTIADQIRPDFLQIANEPSTAAMLTGFALTPAGYADFVRSSIERIGHPGSLLLGAGAGTWEDPAYMTGLLNIPGLDHIDIHIYPIGRDGALMRRAYEIAGQARAAGLGVTISESGLYKVSSQELATLGTDYTTIYRRDAFSFWEPLDEKFIQALTALSRAAGIEFISIFWTRNFFAYLDYDSASRLSDAELNQALNRASIAAVQDGRLSPLGEFYRDWIAGQSP